MSRDSDDIYDPLEAEAMRYRDDYECARRQRADLERLVAEMERDRQRTKACHEEIVSLHKRGKWADDEFWKKWQMLPRIVEVERINLDDREKIKALTIALTACLRILEYTPFTKRHDREVVNIIKCKFPEIQIVP